VASEPDQVDFSKTHRDCRVRGCFDRIIKKNRALLESASDSSPLQFGNMIVTKFRDRYLHRSRDDP